MPCRLLWREGGQTIRVRRAQLGRRGVLARVLRGLHAALSLDELRRGPAYPHWPPALGGNRDSDGVEWLHGRRSAVGRKSGSRSPGGARSQPEACRAITRGAPIDIKIKMVEIGLPSPPGRTLRSPWRGWEAAYRVGAGLAPALGRRGEVGNLVARSAPTYTHRSDDRWQHEKNSERLSMTISRRQAKASAFCVPCATGTASFISRQTILPPVLR